MNIGLASVSGYSCHRASLWQVLRPAASTVLAVLAVTACGGGDPAGAVASGPAASSSPPAAMARAPATAALITPFGDVLASEDFEAGMAGWSDWGNAQVVDGAGVSGSRAMRVGTDAGGAGLFVSGLVAGESYRLTAQVRVSDASELVYLGIHILDASGQRVAQQAVPVTSTSYSPTGLEVATPAGSASAVVFVWKNAGSGYAYIDDLQLARATSSPPPTASNLLSNPGFEAGMASWVDWGNTLVVDAAGLSGSRALRVGTGAGGAGQDVTGIVAGAQYQLSAQVRVSDPSEVAYVGVNLLDASGAVVAQRAVSFSGASFSAATVEVSAPASAVRAVVFVWKNAGSGAAYLDDFAFARSDAGVPPAGTNLVVNAGFEDGLAGWSAFGLANAPTVVKDAASGVYAVRVEGPWAGLAGVLQTIEVVPGQRYTLGAQAKVAAAPDVMYVGIKFIDDLANALVCQPDGCPEPVSYVTFGRATYEAATTEVVAPPTAHWAIVYVGVPDFDVSAGAGYADNISLVATPAPSP